jgi:dephospho-CoA kinase
VSKSSTPSCIPPCSSAQAEQIAEIARTQPDAVVVVESALIFSTKHSGENPWRDRFDRIVVVMAPEPRKVSRFVARASAGRRSRIEDRSALEADARHRLAQQKIAPDQSAGCIVIRNEGDVRSWRPKWKNCGANCKPAQAALEHSQRDVLAIGPEAVACLQR